MQSFEKLLLKKNPISKIFEKIRVDMPIHLPRETYSRKQEIMKSLNIKNSDEVKNPTGIVGYFLRFQPAC